MLLAVKRERTRNWLLKHIEEYSQLVQKHYQDWLANDKGSTEDIAFCAGELQIYCQLYDYVLADDPDLSPLLYHHLVSLIEGYYIVDDVSEEEIQSTFGIIEYFKYHDDRAPEITSFAAIRAEWESAYAATHTMK